MALSFVGYKINGASGSATSRITLSLTALEGGSGTTALEGDIVIAVHSIASTADVSPGIYTGGYTELVDLYSDYSYDTNLSINYKVMGSTPDTSVETLASGDVSNGHVGAVYVWRNQDTSTPFDVSLVSATGTATGVPTPPAITPTTSGSIIVCIGAGAAVSGADFTTATLSGFCSDNGPDDRDSTLGIGYYSWTSGEYTPAQFGGGSTAAQNSWCAVSLALRPLAVSPTVTTQAVSSITQTTATGNGNVTSDGGATITERGVCWNTSTNPTTGNSKATAAGTTGAFTASITGLTNNTLYYVRAYAINSVGTSYGDNVTFTTARAYTLAMGTGTFNLTGYVANLIKYIHNTVVSFTTLTFSVTGYDSILKKAIKLIAETGSFILTGSDTLLKKSISIAMGVGTFTLELKNVIILRTYKIIFETLSFILTGNDVTLKGWDIIQNINKPISSMINITSPNRGEIWGSDLNTWDNELRTWDASGELIGNETRPTTSIINQSK